MKYIKIIIAIAILCVSCIVSFLIGCHFQDEKNYEAACLQADFIRFTIDHFKGETEYPDIGKEIEDCYYEWFEELPNGNFKTKYITDIRQFEDYYWMY